MCSLLLSVFIVGAIESSPGVMTIDYVEMDQMTMTGGLQTQTMLVPTDEYLECWN